MRRKEDAPAIVNRLIDQALKSNASDIHLEPNNHELQVRFRIDGILYDQEVVSSPLSEQLIACLKVRAHLNITEKRVPQDGKFHVTQESREVDFRVSSFPSLYGENLVIRILDCSAHAMSLDMLGFDTETLQKFSQIIHRSQGFFLVAGPTGSGKTTTLYAALSKRNNPDVNIITLEDPVEYNVDGITQGQVNPATGFTFEKGMRALLRQDPDIVMIGEIRDKQTAQIAIQASLTGHLVFSTVHTNDAPSVIMRLMDMGIEPFLINASLTGVLAQRLARRICQKCRVSVQLTEEEQAILNRLNSSISTVYRGSGCTACSERGYKGRIGIFELLIMTNRLRSLVSTTPVFDDILEQAKNDGLLLLIDDGLKKVEEGLITLEELMRVIS